MTGETKFNSASILSRENQDPAFIKKWFWILFISALVLKLSVFFFVASTPEKFFSNSDAYNYYNIASNLIDHGVYSSREQPPLVPNISRTPVYPVLMAGVKLFTGDSFAILILLQVLLGSLTAALMVVFAHALRVSPLVGIISGFVVMLDPLTGLTTYQLLTDTIFTFFFILALVSVTLYFHGRKMTWLILSAVAFGLASLTRPVGQLLPIALIPVFILSAPLSQWKSHIKPVLLFLVISLGITYGWAFRNYMVSGAFTLTADAELDLVYYSARDILVEIEGLSPEDARAELVEYLEEQVAENNLGRDEELALMRKMAFDLFGQYPGLALKVHLKGFSRVMFNPGFEVVCIMLDSDGDSTDCETRASEGLVGRVLEKFRPLNFFEIVVAVWGAVLLAAVYLGAVIGFWLLVRQRNWYLSAYFFILVVYFAVLSSGGVSVSRYRIPLIPLLSMLAGMGFIVVFNYFKAKRAALQEKE